MVEFFKMKKLLVIFLMFLIHYSDSSAAVVFTEHNKVAANTQATNEDKKKVIQHQENPKSIEQYQIEGYVDSKYVRFVVDVNQDNLLTGLMFTEGSKGRYVTGEFINKVLHLYNEQGGHFTVIIP